MVQPDPAATPRVMVWPQPPDLLGPCKAPAGPGNPIPLSSLPWRLPGPPRASQGTAQPKPWFTRGSPHPSPQRVSVMGWGVPAAGARCQGCSPWQHRAGWGATRNAGGQTWGRGCGQGCPSGGGGGRTTSHQRPVASTGRDPEVRWHGTCGALRVDTEKGTQGGQTCSRDPGPAT